MTNDRTERALEILRGAERTPLGADFQERVFQKIRAGNLAIGRRRVPWIPLAAAAGALALAGWLMFSRSVDAPDPVALASDHARRATLALREAHKAQRSPDESRRDYALSGLADRTARLQSLSRKALPPDVRRYVDEKVPRIEAALREGRMDAALLGDPLLQEIADRVSLKPGRTESVASESEEDLYYAGRAALYAGDLDRAIASFQLVLDGHPTGRFRDGAAYWIAHSAAAAGRPEQAVVAYYSSLGGSWLEESDHAALERLIRNVRSSESVVTALPPRGQETVKVTIREVVGLIENGRGETKDVVSIRPQLVTILLDSDWTIIQGDLDARVLRAFQRIQCFYPVDVRIKPGPPADIRIHVSTEQGIRKDPALTKEVEALRRAIPLLWK